MARSAWSLKAKMASAQKSLKAQNLPMLVAALLANGVLVAVLAGSIDSDWLSPANFKRATSSLIVPVLVLLLVNVIPASWRDRLGHLRWNNPLPGNRAFTEYGPADDRIDMVALEKLRGPLPTAAGEQNALWYKLYKEVGSEVSVIESQKRYLLFRDLAAMSLALGIASPVLWFAFNWQVAACAAALFLGEALLYAITSRNTGIRFVTNVLVLHSSKEVPKPKRTAAKKAATP
jgi:hypothetical protein